MGRDRTHRKRKFHKKHWSRKKHVLSLADRTEQNIRCCLLFTKLIPELRNRIYALVLGDRDVHVRKHSKLCPLLDYHICLVPPTTTVSAEQYMQQHQACFDTQWPQSCLDLALLQTCKQIHHEAALIPFSTVNYIISNEAFNRFMVKLSQEQKLAMKQFTMFICNRPSYENFISVDELSGLSNVKHLSITSIGITGKHPFLSLELLARLPLERVSFTLSPLIEYWSEATMESLHAAAIELEAKLLRPWNEPEELERVRSDIANTLVMNRTADQARTPGKEHSEWDESFLYDLSLAAAESHIQGKRMF